MVQGGVSGQCHPAGTCEVCFLCAPSPFSFPSPILFLSCSATCFALPRYSRNLDQPFLLACLLTRCLRKSADFTNATNHANVTVIEYGDPFLGWDYRASGELNTVRRELHLAIRFQAPLLALGEEIRRSAQLHGGAYIGVHLRGESDWPADWGNADQQMALYSAEMARLRAVEELEAEAASGSGYGGEQEEERVSAVYVSSGSQPAIQRFREMLEPSGYVVHDKWTILEALDETGELSLLDDIDFDSKGIVDYAVLAGAKHFMGVRIPFPVFPSSSLSLPTRPPPCFPRRPALPAYPAILSSLVLAMFQSSVIRDSGVLTTGLPPQTGIHEHDEPVHRLHEDGRHS